MLQIGSGKLFRNEVQYRNNLKGIIYTNLKLIRDEKLETAAGSLTPTSNFLEINAILYEFEELIEKLGDEPGVLASHGISYFILDFSSILSFALNCTASPSYTLVDRLLSDQLGVTTYSTPKQIVKRVFDKNVYCQAEEIDFLIKFTKQLIGLDRKTFVGVMNSIKTYVTGMQRIADDFELAYTLLVASLESMAQNFDGHQSTWDDYAAEKKKKIDAALSSVDQVTADNVRNAILANEHTALQKRFKEFSINHINSSYYREEAKNTINPVTRFDLPIALTNAYQARSKYVHNLQKLPKQLTMSSSHSDTCMIENKTWLTLPGLSRLARHVIIEFIFRQNTIEKEIYNYHLERPNIMQLQLSPEYWIADLNLFVGSGVQKFEGFLSQLAPCLEGVPNSAITTLSEVLDKVEAQIERFKQDDKRAYIALYIIYYHFVRDSENLEKQRNFIKKHEKHIANVCTESLIVHHLLSIMPAWELETHYDCLMQYFKQRGSKGKIRCPNLFESSMILQLAERYRLASEESKAIELIEMAVECYPAHDTLRQFEKDYKSDSRQIDWGKILCPEKESEAE